MSIDTPTNSSGEERQLVTLSHRLPAPWRRASQDELPPQSEPPRLERDGPREEQPALNPPGGLQQEL